MPRPHALRPAQPLFLPFVSFLLAVILPICLCNGNPEDSSLERKFRLRFGFEVVYCSGPLLVIPPVHDPLAKGSQAPLGCISNQGYALDRISEACGHFWVGNKRGELFIVNYSHNKPGTLEYCNLIWDEEDRLHCTLTKPPAPQEMEMYLELRAPPENNIFHRISDGNPWFTSHVLNPFAGKVLFNTRGVEESAALKLGCSKFTGK
ncbi:MAG: hypothetical protein M1829_002290 [Trizodia sp. TS-e1964]|nr:MAG: hypothetical protein M1829_002290 [Trizodia sp. TS-e1964]